MRSRRSSLLTCCIVGLDVSIARKIAVARDSSDSGKVGWYKNKLSAAEVLAVETKFRNLSYEQVYRLNQINKSAIDVDSSKVKTHTQEQCHRPRFLRLARESGFPIGAQSRAGRAGASYLGFGLERKSAFCPTLGRVQGDVTRPCHETLPRSFLNRSLTKGIFSPILRVSNCSSFR